MFYKKQPTYNPQITYGHSTYQGVERKDHLIGEVFNGNKKSLISKHKENTDGSRYPRSIQKFDQDRTGHPTKKPVPLMQWLIKTYTNENDLVLDNTMGEGSTGVAAVKEGRRFIGIELDETYFNTAEQDVKQALNAVEMFG